MNLITLGGSSLHPPSGLAVMKTAKTNSTFSRSNKSLKNLPLKKKELAAKKELLAYLSNEYGLTYFNKYFIFKLDHIHKGTLQNLQMPISYEVVLDMFKFYKLYLDQRKITNMRKAKSFTDQHAVLNYDLAIILSMHADYLLVVEEEKAQETAPYHTEQTVKLVKKRAVHKPKDIDEINIENMLDNW